MEKDILGTPPLLRRGAEARLAKVLTLLVYLAAIAVAEWVAAYSSGQDGITIHAFTFAILLFHSHLEREAPERRLLLALALAPPDSDKRSRHTAGKFL